MTRRGALLLITLAAVACGAGTPTGPSTITLTTSAPDIVGRWRGLFETTSCAGEFLDCDGRAVREFMLTLAPSAGVLDGVLVLLDDERTTMNLTATPRAGGGFDFTAAPHEEPGPFPERSDATGLTLRTDPVLGLVGSMAYTTRTTHRVFTRAIEFRSAVRQPDIDVPGNFHGG